MTELRRDPVLGEWVILATDRSGRPNDFTAAPSGERATERCPFCPGNESETPPEVYVEREVGPANGAGWTIRVVPNKFPALTSEGSPESQSDGLLEVAGAIGGHEVIIDSPGHEDRLPDLPVESFLRLVRAMQLRMRALAQPPHVRYVQVFKNSGAKAGATLRHGHTQLLATPLVPPRVEERLKGFARHFEKTGGCVLCELWAEERARGERIVFETDEFVALSPFAARVPYETWLIPKRHQPHFEDADPAQMDGFAPALRELLARTAVCLHHPPYNFCLHTAPVRRDRHRHRAESFTGGTDFPDRCFHWYLEVVPRLSRLAGFEWGTGLHLNSTAPEAAARELQKVHPG